MFEELKRWDEMDKSFLNVKFDLKFQSTGVNLLANTKKNCGTHEKYCPFETEKESYRYLRGTEKNDYRNENLFHLVDFFPSSITANKRAKIA